MNTQIKAPIYFLLAFFITKISINLNFLSSHHIGNRHRREIECLRRSILVCRIFVGKNKKNGNGQKPIAAKITLRRSEERRVGKEC